MISASEKDSLSGLPFVNVLLQYWKPVMSLLL